MLSTLNIVVWLDNFAKQLRGLPRHEIIKKNWQWSVLGLNVLKTEAIRLPAGQPLPTRVGAGILLMPVKLFSDGAIAGLERVWKETPVIDLFNAERFAELTRIPYTPLGARRTSMYYFSSNSRFSYVPWMVIEQNCQKNSDLGIILAQLQGLTINLTQFKANCPKRDYTEH